MRRAGSQSPLMDDGVVAVALSGGVDSAAAAVVLLREGRRVLGVHLKMHPTADSEAAARAVADQLGISLHVFDVTDRFERCVIAPFILDYVAGRTPNPCIECNPGVKFPALLDAAGSLGAEFAATGHYCRLSQNEAGRFRLQRARDRSRDQSYMLYRLCSETLARIRFPIGDLTKVRARQLTADAGLDVAGSPDSQDICFLSTSYSQFLESDRQVDCRPGPIVHLSSGRVLGRHSGIHRFTPGQRRGLGIAEAEAMYVVSVDSESGAVYVGTRAEAYAREVVLERAVLPGIDCPRPSFTADACHRYRSPVVPVRVQVLDRGRLRVQFERPRFAPAPGQSVVLYDGEIVLGGGVIQSVKSTHP